MTRRSFSPCMAGLGQEQGAVRVGQAGGFLELPAAGTGNPARSEDRGLGTPHEELVRTKSAGVLPVQRRKALVKALGSEKPSRKATSSIPRFSLVR